jgi:hypothetical protein
MNKANFQNLINDILVGSGYESIEICLLENQQAKKWYDKKYTRNFDKITENTVYGISIDNMIEYDFKSGKIENLLKSFLVKYASRKTEYRIIDGCFKTVSIKNEVMQNIIQKNQNRVLSGMFYTTLYGIGFWCIFSSKNDMVIAKNLHSFLNDKNIPYENEFSDAGWVYRFVINKDVEMHNDLLKEFSNIA